MKHYLSLVWIHTILKRKGRGGKGNKHTHPELIRRPREPPAVCNPETSTL